jgi:MFS family permease
VSDAAAGRWGRLVLLALAMVGGMSPWLAGSAAAPLLATDLGLLPGEVGWLTSATQLGFVAGTLTLAMLNLADILPGRRLFALAATATAVANATMLLADGVAPLLASRFITGLAMAGVYPPAMKMAATWFVARRGLAIGSIVGALTLGKAFPYLLHGMDQLALAPLVLVPSGAALLGAIAVGTTWHDGPHAFPSRPFSWGLVGEVIRERELRRVTGGYLGHMWELYAFWAWVPGFLGAALAARGAAGGGEWTIAFGVVAIGAVGCIGGGWLADRYGRRTVANGAMITSGTLALLSPALFVLPTWILVAALLLWGVAVIADSAQFSALATEVAPSHAVGTALALQTSLGFLLTIASIQLVPVLVDVVGWRWALAMLAVGPALGVASLGWGAARGEG